MLFLFGGCVVGYQRNNVNLVLRRVKQDQSQYPIKRVIVGQGLYSI